MQRSIITLTTDFGLDDSYVAQMKGVILGINPDAILVDVTHGIEPQNIVQAACGLADAFRAFPAGTLHLVVVDPGVGSARAMIAAEFAGHRFVAPDNGVLSLAARDDPHSRLVELDDPRYWREPVSSTFHGRDIMAPVAAHWSLGRGMQELGRVRNSPLTELNIPQPQAEGVTITGRVLWVDRFGNLITNIEVACLEGMDRERLSVEAGPMQLVGIHDYYSRRPAGTALALIGSSGRLEIAVNQGSAARQLPLSSGATICVRGVSSKESPGEPRENRSR